MARQPVLKLNREKGDIKILKGEEIYVRGMRDSERIYVVPSTETPICV